MKNLPAISPFAIRKIILEQSKKAHIGHIGCALSICDIISALYSKILKISSFNDPKRDRFILSKGHAALALYAALFLKGWLTKKELNSYCQNGTLLGVHPEKALKGVDFSSGSLGYGLSIGAGLALAARIKKESYRVFVLLSDAECNEGSLWEAVMFSSHHQLANLIAIIDVNGQQALGKTKDILNLEPLGRRWHSFCWNVHQVNGHNEKQIIKTVFELDTTSGQPHVLLALTIFGKGVSYMENRLKWHYWPMSEAEYALAKKELCKKSEKRIYKNFNGNC